MSTEITCLLWSSEGSGRAIEGVGGPGWAEDLDTVIGQIEEGRRYYVRLGSTFVNVVLADDRSCPLRTDPAETSENELLTLPTCLLSLEHSR
jgi:hypothetical protein